MNLDELKKPFDPDKVEWRIQRKSKNQDSALVLAYIQARDVMDRLDEVVGQENWKTEYYVAGNTTMCRLSINVNGEWITKEDGAGDTQVEAQKGAISDALKRSAVTWGIGRYLYDMPTPWVKIDKYGNILDIEKQKLYSYLDAKAPKVNGPSGLSKTPAKFWSKPKLVVELPNKYNTGGDWSEEAWSWWKDSFSKGMNKAPTKDILEKYWNDNDHILSQMPAPELEGYREAWEIRIKQLGE